MFVDAKYVVYNDVLGVLAESPPVDPADLDRVIQRLNQFGFTDWLAVGFNMS